MEPTTITVTVIIKNPISNNNNDFPARTIISLSKLCKHPAMGQFCQPPQTQMGLADITIVNNSSRAAI
jgi:hypothetical protein